jgi:ubiquinone/menaquinone biosynthesis C-methylase UbiE
MESNNKEADVQAFNHGAATYETSRRRSYLFEKVQRYVLTLAKTQNKPETILDVECGTGRILRKAKKQKPDARLLSE